MIDLNNLIKGGDFNSYGDSNYALFNGDCLEVMDYLIEHNIQIDKDSDETLISGVSCDYVIERLKDIIK